LVSLLERLETLRPAFNPNLTGEDAVFDEVFCAKVKVPATSARPKKSFS